MVMLAPEGSTASPLSAQKEAAILWAASQAWPNWGAESWACSLHGSWR